MFIFIRRPTPGLRSVLRLTVLHLIESQPSSYKCWLLVCCFLAHYHESDFDDFCGVLGCGDFYKKISSFITSSKLIVPIDIPDLPSLLGASNKRQR